ncbi:hypothetical protein NDU88_004963 [Pleurodeles waltl]|uniref:Uncharacterized protein n=1 Tax=Pleurodeles waltl TaxID=8319 RepID=A0AAV7PEC0_PLEWA|nr:hypothetical protein NDU88_004963 [Pleurodeles waltl]
MQSSVGRQGLTSTKPGLKSHWTVVVTWTELLSSLDHAHCAERGPRGPVMQYFVACRCRGKIPSTHGRFLQSSWCKKEAGYPQSMHHLETVEKAGRMKQYKVASSHLATLLRFCRRPEQSAVDPLAEGKEGDAEELCAAVCANGILGLKDHRLNSWVVIVWAYYFWRDNVGFVIASLSLTSGVADLCGCLDFGGFRAVGDNDCGGIPRPQRCVGGLLHGGKRLLPPML